MEINILGVAAAAFLGGMLVALIGWTESSDTWNWKKFIASVARSLIGAVAMAAAWDYSGATTPIIYLLAAISGAGIEVGGNRIAGAVASRKS